MRISRLQPIDHRYYLRLAVSCCSIPYKQLTYRSKYPQFKKPHLIECTSFPPSTSWLLREKFSLDSTTLPTNKMVQLIRVNKLLVSKGYGTRREVDKLIQSGWVRINGKVAQLGEKYEVPDNFLDIGSLDKSPSSIGGSCQKTSPFEIELDKYAKHQISLKATVILNKPLGYISSQPEGSTYIPAVKLLTMANQYTKHHTARIEPRFLRKLAVAGRLDINSTGLLLFTQCGLTASRIIGPKSSVEKEYIVRITQPGAPKPNTPPRSSDVSSSDLKSDHQDDSDSSQLKEIVHKLSKGITCGGEFISAKAIDVVNRDQLRFILVQGKKHHIRRMLNAVNLHVQALKRVRIGSLTLGQLPSGYWRYVNSKEQLT